jgi:predicted membrane protein
LGNQDIEGEMNTTSVYDSKHLKTLLMVAAFTLLLGVIPIWPYGFYTLLRLIVCGSTGYVAYKEKRHRVALIIIAILFNPIVPVYLIRAIWIPIDLCVGIYLLILSKKFSGIKGEENETVP